MDVRYGNLLLGTLAINWGSGARSQQQQLESGLDSGQFTKRPCYPMGPLVLPRLPLEATSKYIAA